VLEVEGALGSLGFGCLLGGGEEGRGLLELGDAVVLGEDGQDG